MAKPSSKKDSIGEVIANRNPLERTSVTPEDLYSAPEAGEASAPQPAVKPGAQGQESPNNTSVTPAAASGDKASDPVVPFSTYLPLSFAQGLKIRAAIGQNGLKTVRDHTEAALADYFRNNPLSM